MVKYKSVPRLVVKMVMGTANMTACVVFFYLLKRDTHGKNVVYAKLFYKTINF
jgi:hypothetical protein